MGTSSGSRILFWARIVLSASCPRSRSSQYPSPRRPARFLAALPAARLSSVVAGRSCTTAGVCDLGGPDFVMDRSCPDGVEQTLRLMTECVQSVPRRLVRLSGSVFGEQQVDLDSRHARAGLRKHPGDLPLREDLGRRPDGERETGPAAPVEDRYRDRADAEGGLAVVQCVADLANAG